MHLCQSLAACNNLFIHLYPPPDTQRLNTTCLRSWRTTQSNHDSTTDHIEKDRSVQTLLLSPTNNSATIYWLDVYQRFPARLVQHRHEAECRSVTGPTVLWCCLGCWSAVNQCDTFTFTFYLFILSTAARSHPRTIPGFPNVLVLVVILRSLV